jgi:hypothetical protein
MAAMLGFAGAKLFAAIFVMLNLDNWGRRTPLICGLVLMFASSGSLFMFFYDSLQKEKNFEWGFVVLLYLFGMGYEVRYESFSCVDTKKIRLNACTCFHLES